ncbi:hypothetical protein Dimus_016596 [Dionaea muscipula]
MWLLYVVPMDVVVARSIRSTNIVSTSVSLAAMDVAVARFVVPTDVAAATPEVPTDVAAARSVCTTDVAAASVPLAACRSSDGCKGSTESN